MGSQEKFLQAKRDFVTDIIRVMEKQPQQFRVDFVSGNFTRLRHTRTLGYKNYDDYVTEIVEDVKKENVDNFNGLFLRVEFELINEYDYACSDSFGWVMLDLAEMTARANIDPAHGGFRRFLDHMRHRVLPHMMTKHFSEVMRGASAARKFQV